MRNKLGNVCIVLGIVLVFAALSLFAYNQSEALQAEDNAKRVMPKLVNIIRSTPEQDILLPEETPAVIPEMTVVEIDGYGYIGYIAIPSLDLELPVMSEWDYARLKISACRYSGSAFTDDLVLAAHNYQRHFGKLHRIEIGSEVVFTDMDGNETRYVVKLVEELSSTAVAEMTAGDYDLTLFTCTYGGRARVTVRCNRVAPEEEG